MLENRSLIVWGSERELWLLNCTSCSGGTPSTRPTRRFECFNEQYVPDQMTSPKNISNIIPGIIDFPATKCIRALDHYGNPTKYLCSSGNRVEQRTNHNEVNLTHSYENFGDCHDCCLITVEMHENGKISLKSSTGKYLSA